MKYKIEFFLFITPLESHFGIPINECRCGECPNQIKKKDSFIINDGEKYFCRIMNKLLIVFDIESAKDCFKAWFTEGDYLESKPSEIYKLIPEKQRNFYTSDFLNVDFNEFKDGFDELDLEIRNCSII